MAAKHIILPASEIPRQWYNILADIKMNPPLGPDGNPIKPEDLAPVFPMNIIEQEVSTQRWIDIPEPVLDVMAIWRPAPLTPEAALAIRCPGSTRSPANRGIRPSCTAVG